MLTQELTLTDTNHEDDWSIIHDDGNSTIYNVDDGVHALRINSSNSATFAGVIAAPAAVLSTTSTSDYVLRLLDTGVVGYDWSFPDTGTLKLGVNTTATKTFKLINAGSGSFNLEADNVTVSGGGITLGGTGRIQGVDTVSASTDAANKAYVDAQVGSADTLQEVTDNGNTTTNSIGIGTTTNPPHRLVVTDGASPYNSANMLLQCKKKFI